MPLDAEYLHREASRIADVPDKSSPRLEDRLMAVEAANGSVPGGRRSAYSGRPEAVP